MRDLPAISDAKQVGGRLSVAFVVAGFPTRNDPLRGIFNLRALGALSSVSDVTVLHLRAWLPGRRWRHDSQTDVGRVVTVAVPQLPTRRTLGAYATAANVLLYRALGWPAVRDVVESSEVIHSVDGLVGMIASHWAFRARRHHITQVTGSDVNAFAPHIPAFVARGWTRHLHGVACNSRELERRISDHYSNVPNIRTICRGVDTNLFNPAGAQLGPLAHASPVRYAYFGGFRRHALGRDIKGGSILLSAWKQAEEDLPPTASLLLAGPDADEVVIAPWKRTLRYPMRVHVAGRVSPSEMPGYMRATDVVLIPSFEEGLPNVCVEASACGRAVFGSATGGIPEVVRHMETGLLLPRDDVAEWRRALVEYSSRPDALSLMGEHARTRVLDMFDARDYAPSMLDLYRAALSLPAVPRTT